MSFPRYPKYKDSGVVWLGDVPEHWTATKLKHLGQAQIGLTYDPTEIADESEGTLVLRSSNVQQGRIVFDDNVFVQKKIPPRLVTHLGDVLICSRNGSRALIGKNAMIGPDAVGISFGAFMTIFRSDLNHFLFWVFNSQIFELQSASFLTATINQLTIGNLNSFDVLLPPPNEQSWIADFLKRETAKIDALVAEQRRLIELLKEKRQAVISHAVTKGLNPHAPMKPSGIEWVGEVPKLWKVMRIKHLTRSIEQGWSPQCEGFPVETENEWGVLKVGCVNGGTFNSTENKVLPPDLEPIEALGISSGDLLISRANTRELVGSAAVTTKDYPKLLICDKLYRLRLNPDFGSATFLSLYLGSSAARGPIELGGTGASASMVNIGQSIILELEVAVPPIEEQNSIVAILGRETAKLDALTAEAQRATELLQERRTSLISAAVTGKIDVRGLVETEAA